MDFKTEINNYESNVDKLDYIFKKGKVPVLLIAVHTTYQKKMNKLSEPYTGAIVQYVGNECNCFYAIKCYDNGIDSNSLEIDEFKRYILDIIDKNEIKLVLDIHGANINRPFDVEFGSLNSMSADLSIMKSLEEEFKNNQVNEIKYDDPFKGGGITRFIFENSDIDVIQIEINKKFRQKTNIEKSQRICIALINFIKKYANYI